MLAGPSGDGIVHHALLKCLSRVLQAWVMLPKGLEESSPKRGKFLRMYDVMVERKVCIALYIDLT
jgi:hypothetical protein